ncbi:MAG: homoaconitate hydratase [Euryarchaeota archaeon]|nr:homoaconitate hydratase [Euryarchaeota archaeon]
MEPRESERSAKATRKLSMLSPFNDLALKGWKSGKKVVLYDTTLRDGEQMPGVSFSKAQKLRIAQALCDAGVKHIEAGFPAVSKREAAAVKAVAGLRTGAETLALCRARKGDVDACVDCGVDIALIFIATSDIHLEHKYKCSRERAVEMALGAMEYAGERGLRFTFSTEDSTRSDMGYMLSLNKMAERLGAERIGITDTVGCATPESVAHLVGKICAGAKRPVSAHLHNDLGLAVANGLSAVRAGAAALATTVNGIGERAGNLPLEEFAVASELLLGADHGIDLSKLTSVSRLVARAARIETPRNKPIVGGNIFAHESGIHVAAVLNEPFTYEPISPELVGGARRFVLGKHTGIAAIRMMLGSKKERLTGAQERKVLARVKSRGEGNGSVTVKEFWRIVRGAGNGR